MNVLDITFLASLSSLRHSAALTFSLNVINNDIFRLFDDLYLKVSAGETFYNFTEEQERWILTQNTVSRCNLLPKSLAKPVAYIMHSMISEIYYWIRDHFNIIKHIERRHCTHNLRWNPEGTIDRTKTAIRLIRNESIDISARFVIACIYFLEYDIMLLWQMMTKLEKEKVPLIDLNSSVQFWMKLLRKNAKPPWTRWVERYLDIGKILRLLRKTNSQETNNCSRIRLSAFFSVLSRVNRRYFLCQLWPQFTHIDDLRFCLCRMNEFERSGIISQKPRPTNLLSCYINRTYEWIFQNSINQSSLHLTLNCFEAVAHDIACMKILQDIQDFDYLQLLKCLWNMIPDIYKKHIEKRGFLPLIHAVLNYDENIQPLSLMEIFNDHRNREPLGLELRGAEAHG